MLAHAMIKGLVYRKRTIVVLGTIHPALRDVQVYTVVPRFWNSHSIFFKGLRVELYHTRVADKHQKKSFYLETSLLLGAVINASGNDVPATIHIRDVSAPKRTRSRQG
jgi:hypothetical protein